MTTLAFTGHRWLKDEAQRIWAIDTLNEVCLRAAGQGADWFLSGGAPGGDWWFTEAAMLARWQLAGKPAGERFNIPGFPDGIVVSIAVPFKGFLNFYAKKNKAHAEYIKDVIIKYVEPIIIVDASEKPAGRPAMTKMIHARNRWIVDNSDVVVGLYDGRGTGGTHSTLAYAKKKKKRILWLNPVTHKQRWINTDLV